MWKQAFKFLLLLALTWVGHSSESICRETEKCSCTLTTVEDCELRCPKDTDSMFIIEVNSGRSTAVICNMQPSWADFEFESNASVPQEVEAFKFEQCSLPDVPLDEITRRMGVQPTKLLRFESYKNLSTKMERRHLSGFPTLGRLSLNSNGFTKLPEDLFADLTELVMLELRENNLDLPDGIFSGLSKLKKLELGQNNMTRIGPIVFNNLTQLEHLGLWGNLLTSLDPHIFYGLTALNTLNMNGNRLTTLPSEIFRSVGNLKSLYMNSNNFSSLPGDLFSHNKNLTVITMKSNRGNMSTLPAGLFRNLTKLNRIYLSNNKDLVTLPEDLFWNNSALVDIDLRGNSLTTLPKRIFKNLINLVSLDLSDNKISELPDRTFETLRKLERLNLRRNNFTSIPESMFLGLSGLKELDMRYNGLRNIDYGLKPLTGLRIAVFSHNNITLENGNPAPFINSPFDKCTNLEELYLTNNSITKIFNDWSLVLLKLRRLDLQYNKISYISTSDLQFLSTNILVNMTNNNITQIDLLDAEIIATSQPLNAERNVRIDVDNNPLICDGRIYFFVKYLDGEMHPAVQKLFHIMPGNAMCSSPESMIGIRVSDLKWKSLSFEEEIVCPEKCSCSFRPSDSTFLVNCSYRNLTLAPKRIAVNKPSKIELNLAGNLLTDVPFINQSGFSNITALLLSHNNISNVSLENIPPMIEVLELHENNLMKIDIAVLEVMKNSSTLKNVTLHGNPWNCDCEASDFLSFVQTKFKKIPALLKVTCAGNKKPLFEMTPNNLCPLPMGEIISASMSVALLGLLIGTLAALYYRYRTEIKVWLWAHQLCLWFITEEDFDKDKQYDAFISYSHKDEEFVHNKLIPKLEEGPRPFKLCVHFRDWMAGEWIPAQIARSVEDSRRTVVVLSPNFLESVWGRMEFRAAHSQALSEGRARVIVILLGDIGPRENLDPELKAYLSMNTYVEWGDPWFWDKLRYALPHPPRMVKKAARKIFESHQHHIRINGDKSGLIHLPGVPVTPPAITTPPADSLKTYISNDNKINGSILITDSLKNENKFDDFEPKKPVNDDTINNGQCTAV